MGDHSPALALYPHAVAVRAHPELVRPAAPQAGRRVARARDALVHRGPPIFPADAVLHVVAGCSRHGTPR